VFANFGVALLAGLGFDAAWRKLPRSSYLPGLLLAATGLLAAAFRYPDHTWWLPALLPIVAIASFSRNKPVSMLAASGLGLLLLADLVGVSRNPFELPYVHESWRKIGTHSRMLNDVARRAGQSRTFLVGAGLQLEWQIKAAMLEKFFSPVDYEPIAMKRTGDFFEYAAFAQTLASGQRIPFAGGFPNEILKEPTPRGHQFLRLLSVRFFVFPRLTLMNPGLARFAAELRTVPTPEWTDGSDAGTFVLLEDPAALPRSYGVYQAECLPALDQQLARLAAPEFDPVATVLLDGDCQPEGAPNERPAVVSVDSYAATRVQIVAEMAQPGFVVLTDSYYPGWQAYVNGHREPILRANTLVRAVRVPSGRSQIEFRYAPWPFYLGVAMASVPIAVGLFLGMKRLLRHG
jgi:hypothetical protein